MIANSQSSSDLLATLLYGSVVKGAVLGRHYLRFGDYIVSLTAPGAARMPNGIEVSLRIPAGMRVSIGRGRLAVGQVEITPGADWNPVPVFDPISALPAGPEPQAGKSWMAQAKHESDGLLAGYVAGLVLLHGQRAIAERVAVRAILDAEPRAATLLLHAVRGEVPEPVHRLLATGEASRLIAWTPYGVAWLRGLVSAGLPLDLVSARITPGRRTA